MSMYDDAKEIFSFLQESGSIKIKKMAMDLQASLMEMREENWKLKEKVSSLEERLETKENLTFEQDCYWLEKEGGEKDGPFCSVCWDSNEKLIRLHFRSNPDYSVCHICKKKIAVKRENPPEGKPAKKAIRFQRIIHPGVRNNWMAR